MGEFIEDFDLQFSVNELQEPETIHISREGEWDIQDAERVLEYAVEAIAVDSDNIRNEEYFDVYRWILKTSAQTGAITMGKLLDSISSGLKAELNATIQALEAGDEDAYMSHKLPLELYAYLLNWFSATADKVKVGDGDAPAPKPKRGRGGRAAASKPRGKEAWSWEAQIPDTLTLIVRLLTKVNSQRIWTTTSERDVFIGCLTRPANMISLNEQYMKNTRVRNLVFDVWCNSVKHHGQSVAFNVTLITALDLHEHLSEPMANCLYLLATTYDHPEIADEVLREIASKQFTGEITNKAPRVYAKFLVAFANLAPRLVQKQLALLREQEDSDAYPIRQAIIEILGILIIEVQQTIDSRDLQEHDKDAADEAIANMFGNIFDRRKDTSGYVRTKILAIFSKICDYTYNNKPKFAPHRLRMAKYVARHALQDKVMSVRKGAISLLIKLLDTHPYTEKYGGLLLQEDFKRESDELAAKLSAFAGLGKVDMVDGQEKRDSRNRDGDEMDVDSDQEGDAGGDTEPEDGGHADGDMSIDEDENGAGPSKRKKSKLKPRKSRINLEAVQNEQAVLAAYDTAQLSVLKFSKKFWDEGLLFIQYANEAAAIIEKLLGSKSKSEVTEAIEFFKKASDYKIEGAQSGIKKMLHLIWTKDNNAAVSINPEDGDPKDAKGVKQKLLECYKDLYFEFIVGPPLNTQIARIARNVIGLTYDASLAELTSLEEMLRIMMEEGSIEPAVIAKLWSVYGSHQILPKPQRRGAIIILGMLGVAKPREVLADHIGTMLKVGLGKLGREDLSLARYTCVALQRLNGSAKKVKGSLEDKTIRMPMDNEIFQKLMTAILHPSRSKDWFGTAEQVINTVYALGSHPAMFCDELIKKLSMRAFGRPAPADSEGSAAAPAEGQDKEKEGDDDAMDQDEPATTQTPEAGSISVGPSQQRSQSQSQGPSSSAPKSVGDSFELAQLVFAVGHVAIKHIVHLEIIEKEWKRQKDPVNAAKGTGAAGQGAKDKDADELDQVVGNAEDEIGDHIAGVREKELLYGPESLLAVYAPIIVFISGTPAKFKNPTLRAAAILAFSKLLCVSSQFCDEHHRVLFRLLEKSKDENVRSNIVIALGDVAVAFSNIIDENSADLYKGLSDRSMTVKKNTLMVLTHLILNGMIKVKGQLGEMAKCVEDEDARISDLARLFFSELSTKENAIYNNLPDVISHLSAGEHAVDEKKFESTMTYIFTFIEKEKQAEAIVDKLCQRFQLAETERQWRDIAFCLQLLPFKSEKSVKKLIDGLQYYRDKLHEPVVFQRFQEILSKARQNKAKDRPETELDEFEKARLILDQHRQQGEEDQALQNRVNKKKKKAAKQKKGGRKGAAMEEDEE